MPIPIQRPQDNMITPKASISFSLQTCRNFAFRTRRLQTRRLRCIFFCLVRFILQWFQAPSSLLTTRLWTCCLGQAKRINWFVKIEHHAYIRWNHLVQSINLCQNKILPYSVLIALHLVPFWMIDFWAPPLCAVSPFWINKEVIKSKGCIWTLEKDSPQTSKSKKCFPCLQSQWGIFL